MSSRTCTMSRSLCDGRIPCGAPYCQNISSTENSRPALSFPRNGFAPIPFPPMVAPTLPSVEPQPSQFPVAATPSHDGG